MVPETSASEVDLVTSDLLTVEATSMGPAVEVSGPRLAPAGTLILPGMTGAGSRRMECLGLVEFPPEEDWLEVFPPEKRFDLPPKLGEVCN